VLIGIGEQLDFVDGRHDAEHRTDGARPRSSHNGVAAGVGRSGILG
jgi:hypothetical protein